MKINKKNAREAGAYQQALLSNHNNPLNSPANDMVILFRFDGKIDIELLKRITDFWVDEHPILRSIYNASDQKLCFTILPELPINITTHRIKNTRELKNKIKSLTENSVDLAHEIVRINIFEIDDYSIFLSQWHHIAGDFFSVNYLLSQFITVMATNELPNRNESDAKYTDFIDWQCNYLSSEQANNTFAFWDKKISSYRKMPIESPSTLQPLGSIQLFEFNLAESNQIQVFCKSYMVTPSQFFMAVYQEALKHIFSQLSEFIMMPINTRPGSNFRNSIGYFVNFIPVNFISDKKISFITLLQTIKSDLLSSLQNSYYPFNLVLDDSSLYTNMMKVLYKFQTGIVLDSKEIMGLKKLHRYGISEGITSLDDNLVAYPRGDLSLIVSHENQQFYGAFHYRLTSHSLTEITTLSQIFKEIIIKNV